jgi:hypothetical protein
MQTIKESLSTFLAVVSVRIKLITWLLLSSLKRFDNMIPLTGWKYEPTHILTHRERIAIGVNKQAKTCVCAYECVRCYLLETNMKPFNYTA